MTDDHRIGDHRAKPVKEIQDLRTCHTGEEILVSSGEADDLVREDGSYDEKFIVVKETLVDVHFDFHGKESA